MNILQIIQTAARLVKLQEVPVSSIHAENEETLNLLYLANQVGKSLVRETSTNGGWIFTQRTFEFSLEEDAKVQALPQDYSSFQVENFVERNNITFKPKFLYNSQWSQYVRQNSYTGNYDYYRINYNGATQRHEIEFLNAPNSNNEFSLIYSSYGWLFDPSDNRYSEIVDDTHNILLDNDLYITTLVAEFKTYDGQPDADAYLIRAEKMLIDRLYEQSHGAPIRLNEQPSSLLNSLDDIYIDSNSFRN